MSTSPELKPTFETRVIGALVLLILLLAFVALYIFPENTDVDFAWTIRPSTMAILIGEGYMAGALFFFRVITVKKWHTVQVGFLPITLFTVVIMAATFLHWDRFHQGTFIFYLWTVVYAITPFLVPFLWWRNRSRDPHTLEENDLRYSRAARMVVGGMGVAGMVVALVSFIMPSFYIWLTPWKLTELTARILSGWTFLASAAFLSVALDGRWSATRLLLQSWMFGQALTLIALPRIWNDLNLTNPMAYGFITGLVASLVASAAIYAWAEWEIRRRRTTRMQLVNPAGN